MAQRHALAHVVPHGTATIDTGPHRKASFRAALGCVVSRAVEECVVKSRIDSMGHDAQHAWFKYRTRKRHPVTQKASFVVWLRTALAYFVIACAAPDRSDMHRTAFIIRVPGPT